MSLQDDVVRKEELSKSLICPICVDVLQDPVFYGGRPCQHVFCKGCINTALQQRKECPVCRSSIQEDSVQQKHLVLNSMLDEIEVKCVRRCGWIGRLDARTEHMVRCPFVLLDKAEVEKKSLIQRLTESILLQDVLLKQVKDQEKIIAQRDGTIASLTTEAVAAKDFLVRKVKDQEQIIAQRDGTIASLASRQRDFEAWLATAPHLRSSTPSSSSGAGADVSNAPAVATVGNRSESGRGLQKSLPRKSPQANKKHQSATASAIKRKKICEASKKLKSKVTEPKRPPSAYFMFLHDSASLPEICNLQRHERVKALCEKWKHLGLDEKRKYDQEAAEKKKLYEEELKRYRETPAYKAYEKVLARLR